MHSPACLDVTGAHSHYLSRETLPFLPQRTQLLQLPPLPRAGLKSDLMATATLLVVERRGMLDAFEVGPQCGRFDAYESMSAGSMCRSSSWPSAERREGQFQSSTTAQNLGRLPLRAAGFLQRPQCQEFAPSSSSHAFEALGCAMQLEQTHRLEVKAHVPRDRFPRKRIPPPKVFGAFPYAMYGASKSADISCATSSPASADVLHLRVSNKSRTAHSQLSYGDTLQSGRPSTCLHLMEFFSEMLRWSCRHIGLSLALLICLSVFYGRFREAAITAATQHGREWKRLNMHQLPNRYRSPFS